MNVKVFFLASFFFFCLGIPELLSNADCSYTPTTCMIRYQFLKQDANYVSLYRDYYVYNQTSKTTQLMYKKVIRTCPIKYPHSCFGTWIDPLPEHEIRPCYEKVCPHMKLPVIVEGYMTLQSFLLVSWLSGFFITVCLHVFCL